MKHLTQQEERALTRIVKMAKTFGRNELCMSICARNILLQELHGLDKPTNATTDLARERCEDPLTNAPGYREHSNALSARKDGESC